METASSPTPVTLALPTDSPPEATLNGFRSVNVPDGGVDAAVSDAATVASRRRRRNRSHGIPPVMSIQGYASFPMGAEWSSSQD